MEHELTGSVPSGFAAAFERAASAQGGALQESRFLVGGRVVSLRVAGPELASLLARPFLAADTSATPALRIDLWDERATGIDRPATADPDDEIGERHGPFGERFAPSRDGRRIRYSGPDFDIRLDRPSGHAVGWVRAAERLSSWHRARPLQTLLWPWLASQGMVVLHAAMVARPHGGVVIAGASGVGKSTVAAACAEAGFAVLGDDGIAVEPRGDGAMRGHCLHATVKLRQDGMVRQPGLAPHAEACGPPWEGDFIVYFSDGSAGSAAPTATIRAVATPRLGDRPESRVTPTSGGQALAALTGCALSVEPGRVAADFAALGELADRVPAVTLEVGTRIAGIPAELDALLERVSA